MNGYRSLAWFSPVYEEDRYNASEPNYYRGMQMRPQSRYRVYLDSYLRILMYVHPEYTNTYIC